MTNKSSGKILCMVTKTSKETSEMIKSSSVKLKYSRAVLFLKMAWIISERTDFN